MSGKQTTMIIFAAALVGGVLGAGAMQYVRPVSSVVPEVREGRPHEEREGRPHEERASTPGHNERDSHEQHDDEPAQHSEEQEVVRLSQAAIREFSIEGETAGPGTLQMHVTLPGEVALNADRRAHIVSRIPGVVNQVRKTLGDRVRRGEVMAVLDSRELADMKSAYLAATERVALAASTFRREDDLRKKKITSEQEYLEAKQALAEARIALRAAQQKLRAIGFSNKTLTQLPGQPDTAFTKYAVTAPFDGTVIKKHVTLGEVLQDDTAAFVIADLRSVWVNLQIYQKDLPFVRQGQPVLISAGRGIPDAQGEISYVGPLVGEQTRTALARVVLPNPDGHWRPGLFVTGKIVVEDVEVPLRVPKTALQTIEKRPTIFVRTAAGLQPQPVTLGRSNDAHVEITTGLEPGQWYVTRGTFTLKAQLSKGAFGDGHGH